MKISDSPVTILNRIPYIIQSFGETPIKFRETLNHLAKLWQGGKKERAQDGFSASRARLRVLNTAFEKMIWRNSAGKSLRQGFSAR